MELYSQQTLAGYELGAGAGPLCDQVPRGIADTGGIQVIPSLPDRPPLMPWSLP